MAESSGEKTFEATAHRRQQAREQGQVAFSQDLGSAVLLLVGGLLFLFMGGQIVEFSIGLMRRDLEAVATLSPDPGQMMVHWHQIMKGFAAQLSKQDIEDLAAWFSRQKSSLHDQR